MTFCENIILPQLRTMETWRLLDTGIKTAAENMALDEAILTVKGEGVTPNTVRFLQFYPEAVLVGCHQSVDQEVRMPFCGEHHIDINRRITGGGAIFFDKAQIGWEIVASKEDLRFRIPHEEVFKKMCEPIIQGLKRLGIEARYRSKNDIEVKGRKISGTGGTEYKGAFLFQGTLLVDLDVEKMLRALRVPIEKLKERQISSLSERMTCLKRELGFIPPTRKVKEELKRGFQEVFHVDLVDGGLTETEEMLFAEYLPKYQSDDWIHLIKSPPEEKQILRGSHKSKGGLIRVFLAYDVKREMISNMVITGDFFVFPRRAIYDLEARLKGCHRDRVADVLRKFFMEKDSYIPHVNPEDFSKAIGSALEKVDFTRYGLTCSEANRIFTVNGRLGEILAKDINVLLLPYCAKLPGCRFRKKKGCAECEKCDVGYAYNLGKGYGLIPESIQSFEDLMRTLLKYRLKNVQAFIGCCCEQFFIKHKDDFERIGMPGILVTIDDETCYDLGKDWEAYSGSFENLTHLRLDLLEKVVKAREKYLHGAERTI